MLIAALVFLATTQAAAPPPRTVLAIGAHADDIEFGCGATLARHRASSFRVSKLTTRTDRADRVMRSPTAAVIWAISVLR